MVSFQVFGQPALRFKVAARSVLFAGSRRGQVEQPVCRALVERFRRHGFGFFVGCATGVDAAFRAALAHSACGPDEVFVGCAFGRRARRCRAEGLFASAVVSEGIPPRAALARRTLWLVKRSSLVVLFPERPADRQWGPGLAACLSLGALPPQADLRGGLTAACRSGVLSGGGRRPVRHGRWLLGGAAYLPRRPLRRRVLRVQIGASAAR